MRLWSGSRNGPDVLVLRPGTLDRADWLKPVANIWTRSKQPWVPIPDVVLRFEKGPDDPLELVRLFRSRMEA